MDIDQPATLSGQRRSREEDVESSCSESSSESFRSKRSRVVVQPTEAEMIARLQQAKPPVEGLLGKLLRSDPDKVDWSRQDEGIYLFRLLRGRYELEICRSPHEVTRAFYEYLYKHLNNENLAIIADPLLDVLQLAFKFVDRGIGIVFESCQSVRDAMGVMEFLRERGFWPIPEFLEGEYVTSVSGLVQHIVGMNALEKCSTVEQMRQTAQDYFTPELKHWRTHPLVWALMHKNEDSSELMKLLRWPLDENELHFDDPRERSLVYQIGYDEDGEVAIREVLRWAKFLLAASDKPKIDSDLLLVVIDYFDLFKSCESTLAAALELLKWLLSVGAVPTPEVLEYAQSYPSAMQVLTDGVQQ